MAKEIGFVFSNTSTIDLMTNEVVHRSKSLKKTGVYDSNMKKRKRKRRYRLISPSACLYRKKDMIDALYQGGLPLSKNKKYHGVGPDYFMMLLALLRYKKFAFVAEHLAFFSKHDGSITLAAHANNKETELKQAYRETYEYFQMLKWYKKYKFLTYFFAYLTANRQDNEKNKSCR